GDAVADVVNVSDLRIGPVFEEGTVNATGTLHVTGPVDLGPGTGHLGGSGAVTVGGLLSLFHGTLFGPATPPTGGIFANGGMTLSTSGGGFTLDGCRLDNNGTATWASNAGQPLIFQNGAVINNNGTFDIQVDSQIADVGGTA